MLEAFLSLLLALQQRFLGGKTVLLQPPFHFLTLRHVLVVQVLEILKFVINFHSWRHVLRSVNSVEIAVVTETLKHGKLMEVVNRVFPHCGLRRQANFLQSCCVDTFEHVDGTLLALKVQVDRSRGFFGKSLTRIRVFNQLLFYSFNSDSIARRFECFGLCLGVSLNDLG